MSYSFSVIAATKAEASERVAGELAKVIEFQPQHAVEKQAVQDATAAFVHVLTDPVEGEVVKVSVHGSLGWRGEGVYNQASVGISASIAPASKE